jgi:hypothetical protein
LVKDLRYVFFARICVLSFLHYHPKSNVVIHSDEFTHQKLVRTFQREIARGLVRVEPVLGNWHSWQEMKVLVISQLERSRDFFVDADMRFRGAIPELKKPTLFVREFRLCEVFPFSLLREFWSEYSLGQETWMLNSSFVWLGDNPNEIVKKLQLKAYRKFQADLKKCLNLSQLGNEATNQIWRLREQIFISLVLSDSEEKIDTLKKSDARLDGKFLESAYFGSTGLGF